MLEEVGHQYVYEEVVKADPLEVLVMLIQEPAWPTLPATSPPPLSREKKIY